MYNIFKPHIVQFKDGTFGVRVYKLFHWEYLDLVYEKEEFWWEQESRNFMDCKGTLKQIDTQLARFKALIEKEESRKRDKGTRVNT